MFSLNKINHSKLLFPAHGFITYVKPTRLSSLYSFSTKRNYSLFTHIQNSSPLTNATTINNTIILSNRSLPLTSFFLQRRHRAEFAPRRTKYRKAHKGRVPVRIGGSTKGNSIECGSFGLRVKDGVRLSSAQLTAAHTAIK